MTLKIKLNHILLGLAVVMLMLSTNAVAIAQVGDPENRLPVSISRQSTRNQRAPFDVPGGPGHLMLGAFEFHPFTMDTEWAYYDFVELYNPGAEPGVYLACVHLPDGATVNKLVMYFYDLREEDMIVSLFRVQSGGGTPQPLAAIGPTGLGGYQFDVDTSIDNALIDMANYSYYVGVTIPTGAADALTFIQARIDYDYPTFLPTVLK